LSKRLLKIDVTFLGVSSQSVYIVGSAQILIFGLKFSVSL